MLLKASFLLIFYLCLANAFPSILETAAGDSKCGYEVFNKLMQLLAEIPNSQLIISFHSVVPRY